MPRISPPREPFNATTKYHAEYHVKSTHGSLEDYETALAYYQRSLKVRKASERQETSATAQDLINLASVYINRGENAIAIRTLEKALRLREKIDGREHPRTGDCLVLYADRLRSEGEYEQALPLYQRALSMKEKEKGPNHPETATRISKLAKLYEYRGEQGKALALHLRALKIREDALGTHPATQSSLARLAILHLALGKPKEALEYARREAAADLVLTEKVYSVASERQRMSFRTQQDYYSIFATLGSAPDLLQNLLRYKGLVLDSTVEDLGLAEAGQNKKTKYLAREIRRLKKQINRSVFESAASQSGNHYREQYDRLRLELDTLQSRLSQEGRLQQVARRAFTVTPEQVQSTLPQNAALIEFLRYPHVVDSRKRQWRYGAVIVPPSGNPTWVPLGDAQTLDNLVSTYKDVVRGRMNARAVSLWKDPGATVSAELLLGELHAQIWAPVQEQLPGGIDTVVLCPDGQLNFLSFATLLAPNGKLVAQEFSVAYVASGRDLLTPLGESGKNKVALVGNPDFESGVSTGQESSPVSRAVSGRDWGGVNFAPLPYTDTECKGLQTYFQERGVDVVTFTNENATEGTIRQLDPPETLHLATHGYFLPATNGKCDADDISSHTTFKDPMFRSGLALAGAQKTIEARRLGLNPPHEDDGLLTAAEVGLLSLRGTRLVTLSACDTGSGESQAGEGVLGLRRGFVQAGAQNLVLTLWPVADRETSQLMQEFYRRAQVRSAPLALAEVQREWLVRLREESSLADAVRLAGPFVLSFQGPLQ